MLTSVMFKDANYVNVLLLTYHSWTTAMELLGTLIQSYNQLSSQPEQNKVALMRYVIASFALRSY